MMRYAPLIITGLMLGVAGVSSPANALLESQSLPTDSRLRTVLYDPNQVFRFVGHYGFQSSIEFAMGEEIQTVSVGDSVSWQMVPSGHRLFLKPIEQDASTNMTVVTNKRTYHFELDAEETEDIRDKNMVFVMSFAYPDTSAYIKNISSRKDALPEPVDQPELYRFNYTMSGPEHIAPIKVFDDGEFTYFEFRRKNAIIPAFFVVESDNSESLVNYRMVGDYLVVERVAPRFTLRHGPDVICVFNEDLYIARDVKDKK